MNVLQTIRNRRSAVKSAPWAACTAQDGRCNCGMIWCYEDRPVCKLEGGGTNNPRELEIMIRERDFIAWAPNDIDWLVDRVVQLENQLVRNGIEVPEHDIPIAYSYEDVRAQIANASVANELDKVTEEIYENQDEFKKAMESLGFKVIIIDK